MKINFISIKQYYLPRSEDLNRDFYNKVFRGEKKIFKVSEMKMIIVPKIEELSTKLILEQVKHVPDLLEYLPDNYEKKR